MTAILHVPAGDAIVLKGPSDHSICAAFYSRLKLLEIRGYGGLVTEGLIREIAAPAAAGIAQFQLVHIHPFVDGKGGTSRLLSTLCL